MNKLDLAKKLKDLSVGDLRYIKEEVEKLEKEEISKKEPINSR